MIVALVSSPAEVASLETLLVSAGWRTRLRDIDGARLRGEVGVDWQAEMETDTAPSGGIAILLSVSSPESALLLDRVIGGYSGQGIPVILVTPRGAQRTRRQFLARAMKAGADDFVIGTSVQDELLLRLDALAWRRRPARERRMHFIFDIAIDRAGRRLLHDGTDVGLTAGEFRVFSCLAQCAGRTVSRASIHQSMLRHSRSRSKNLVDVYILYLRRKLAELHCSCVIRTERGVGYALVPAPSDAARTRPTRGGDDSANSLAS
jgi:DNA-binding response OmpR family regulator